MAQPKFDYAGAIAEGYSNNEISDFLRQLPSSKQSSQSPQSSKNTQQGDFLSGNGQQQQKVSSQTEMGNQNLSKNNIKFNYQGALDEGYSPEEINEFLSTYKPERSTFEKAGRLAGQVALGAGEMALLGYELGVSPLALPGGQEALGDLFTRDILSEVYPTEEEGKFVGQREFKEPVNLGIRGLAEKATGLDLHPEGVLEKAAGWMGFIKNPQNIKNLASIGLTPKTLTKALFPEPSEAIRGLTAGAGLQMAEEGKFGPLGTLAAAITGDVLGMGVAGAGRAIAQPRKTLAQVTSLFGEKAEKTAIRDIIDEAEKVGIQLDAGTLVDSDLVRFVQARAAQSALSGKSLDNFRKNLSGQIVKQYESVADELGTLAFENNHQAAEAVRSFVNQEERSLFREPFTKEELKGARPLSGRIAIEERPNIQQEFLTRIASEEFRNSYEAGEALKTVAEDIKAPIKEQFNHRWENLNRSIEGIPAGPQAGLARVLETFIEDQRGSLLLGESTAESKVLQAATRLRDALEIEGGLVGVSLRDLMKTKRTLGDVANWEFGGSNFQSAYKQIVGEIDRAIERTLGELNPQLRSAYEQLNAEYSMFKDVFENKNVMPLFEPKNENYNTIYNGFLKNPDKLRSLEDMMFASPRGQQVINQVKRDYAQRVIESPNLSGRDLRNLDSVLGPQFEGPIQEFTQGLIREMEHPLPRAARQPALGARVEIPEARPGKPLTGRGAPKDEHARRKLLEQIKGKSSDQIMKQMMDTPEGIQKLRRALSLTSEGEELFNKLARYKLHEMIDRNLMDNLAENVKLGKFSGLFRSSKAESVVRELVGPESFAQIRLLQKNAARLQASAEKFYNASKSGTTLLDAGLASTALTGIFTGNPYLALPAIGKIGGLWVAARLLTDAKFLGYLKEAVLTSKTEKLHEILKSMKPAVDRAIAREVLESRAEK